jgi:hypothetical protein
MEVGNMLKLGAIFIAASIVLIANSASARMPNPDSKAWTDHTRPVGLGSDLQDQHYATVTVRPLGNGKVQISYVCENGAPRTINDGYFQVFFRQGKENLFVQTHQCNVDRRKQLVGGAHGKVPYNYNDVDISGIIDRVDIVTLFATHGPSNGNQTVKLPDLKMPW